MNDSSTMQINKRLKKLRHNVSYFVLNYFLLVDIFEKLSSFTELYDQNIVIFVIVDLEKSSDVGMIDRDHDLHLS